MGRESACGRLEAFWLMYAPVDELTLMVPYTKLSMDHVGLPVYQWLDGPQLETDWRLTAAWDWTF